MPYTNDKGETIDVNTYVNNKYKQLFEKDGAQVFKDIQNDKNLTPEERQTACLSIGKAATRFECRDAKEHPETLLRGGEGTALFISAYVKANAKGYFDAITEQGKNAVQNPELSEQEMSNRILSSFTTELPKLSKEVTEFLKVTCDVVKEEFPDQSDKLSARILVNNMSLRGGNSAIGLWLKFNDNDNREAVKVRGDVQKKNGEAYQPVGALHDKLGGIQGVPARDGLEGTVGLIETLEKEMENTPGQLEKGVIQKKLDEARLEQSRLKKEIEKVTKEQQANIEKVAKEGEEALAPHLKRLEMIDRGMKANNKALEQVNHIDGFKGKVEELGEGELDVSGYQESMEKISLGKVEGLEVGGLDVPEVDMDGVKLLIDSEKEEVAKRNQIQAKLEGEQKVEHVKNTFAESQKKAPEELAKIKGLEGQLDKLNYAQRLLKNPNMKPMVDGEGNKIEPYKPTGMERFKAFFTKGGMDAVLEKKKAPIIEQTDRLKMQVQVKTDSDFVETVQKHATEGQKVMDQRMGQLERTAQFYEAAVQQVYDAKHTLNLDNNLGKSGLGTVLSNEERQEVQTKLREGELAMAKYEESYGEYKQLEHQKEVSVKNQNVRGELLKEKATHEKVQSQTQDQGVKVKQPSNGNAPSKVKM